MKNKLRNEYLGSWVDVSQKPTLGEIEPKAKLATQHQGRIRKSEHAIESCCRRRSLQYQEWFDICMRLILCYWQLALPF